MGWFDKLSSQDSISSIYLDDLNLLSGLQVFWLLLTRSVVSVKYLVLGKFGGSLVFLAKHLNLCESVEALDVDFSSAIYGGGLWYAVEKRVQDFSKGILKQLDEKNLLVDYLPVETSPERRSAYMRKLLEIDLYRIVVLALLAERESETIKGKSIILARLSDLTSLANALVKIDDLSIQPIVDLRNSLLLRAFLFFWKQAKLAISHILYARDSSSQHTKAEKNRVAIQYSWGLDQENRMDDLWWFRDSDVDPSRLIIYFNRRKNPATDEIVNFLESEGINYTILDDEANKTLGVPTKKYINRRFRWIWPDSKALLKILLGANRLIASRWQIKKWFQVHRQFRFWQAFMLEEDVKVIFDVGETAIDTAALAADAVGAIKIGMHWSDQCHPRARLLPLPQVFFVWGKHYRDVYKEMASPGVLVEAGCIYDEHKARDLYQQNGQLYRHQLNGVGVDFVIGVLDRSLHPMCHIPSPYHAEFYETLFQTVIENSGIGLVIKPKYPGKLRIISYSPQLEDILEGVIATQRVVILDGKRHVLESGYSADIVVVLGPNSGGIICALQGSKVISWDPSNAARGIQGEWVSQVGWGDDRIVFADMKLLIEAALAERKIPPRARQLGNFSDYLDKIDSFRDGRASERVGGFVKDLLVGLDQDLDRNGAIDYATEKYRTTWGNDKVTM